MDGMGVKPKETSVDLPPFQKKKREEDIFLRGPWAVFCVQGVSTGMRVYVILLVWYNQMFFPKQRGFV